MAHSLSSNYQIIIGIDIAITSDSRPEKEQDYCAIKQLKLNIKPSYSLFKHASPPAWIKRAKPLSTVSRTDGMMQAV